jgi:adenine-specific DNA-methyltransferase
MIPNLFEKEKLLFYVENYETTQLDKKQRGVVFTPMKTVELTLSKLPEEVWSNPDLKWLDPCCGIGNFSVYVYFKLMNTLSIFSEEERRKHILENMLHMVEMKDSYYDIVSEIFLSDKYRLNLFKGSYVSLHTLDQEIPVYDPEFKFNIIIGNPPYQKENKIDPSKLSAKPLYHLFVERSLDLLNQNGYLNFIHPVSWRRKSKEIKILQKMTQHYFVYLYTSNHFEPFKTCSPYINIYVLQKRSYDIKLITEYETYFDKEEYRGKINIPNNLSFMPFLLCKEVLSIINKMTNVKGEKLNVQLESKFSTSKKNIRKDKTEEYKFKNIHTNHKKKGILYRYSNKKHPCHDKLKIVMNFKGGYKNLLPFIEEGSSGITDNSMYMCVTEENKDFLLDFLKSELIYFLLKITNYNFGSNHKNEFHIMNLITIPNNKNYHKFYHLTQGEINFIKIS